MIREAIVSAWRRVALESASRSGSEARRAHCRKIIGNAETPYLMWIALWSEFEKAHDDPMDEAFIGGVYDYAQWCIAEGGEDASGAAVVSFYEELPTVSAVRRAMHRWMPIEVFEGMKDVFRYNLSTEQYAQFLHEFRTHSNKWVRTMGRPDARPTLS